jgi:hypothetical protein
VYISRRALPQAWTKPHPNLGQGCDTILSLAAVAGKPHLRKPSATIKRSSSPGLRRLPIGSSERARLCSATERRSASEVSRSPVRLSGAVLAEPPPSTPVPADRLRHLGRRTNSPEFTCTQPCGLLSFGIAVTIGQYPSSVFSGRNENLGLRQPAQLLTSLYATSSSA